MREIPYISEEMMAAIEKIFYHGPSRAKNHDQRLGQWLINKLRVKYPKADPINILFNLENQELWDLLKDYNN